HEPEVGAQGVDGEEQKGQLARKLRSRRPRPLLGRRRLGTREILPVAVLVDPIAADLAGTWMPPRIAVVAVAPAEPARIAVAIAVAQFLHHPEGDRRHVAMIEDDGPYVVG